MCLVRVCLTVAVERKVPIMHLDFKSPNVMLFTLDPNAKAVAKITDFGTSRFITTEYENVFPEVENPVWLAPEIIQKRPFNKKVDTYSFGVILWELLTRRGFFVELTFMSEIAERVRMPLPSHSLTLTEVSVTQRLTSILTLISTLTLSSTPITPNCNCASCPSVMAVRHSLCAGEPGQASRDPGLCACRVGQPHSALLGTGPSGASRVVLHHS